MINLEKLQQKAAYPELESFIIRPSKIPRCKKPLQKFKSGQLFEKRVWRLFYNFNAEIMNGCKKEKGKKEEDALLTFDLSSEFSQGKCRVASQQIDNCFVIRNKYVFFIECKFRNRTQKAKALIRGDLSNWKDVQKSLENRFEQIFGKKNSSGSTWIFMHIIATEGIDWSKYTQKVEGEEGEEEVDPIKQLAADGFIVLREKELQYFENIYENSKSEWFAFNQFISEFKPDQNFMQGKGRSWSAFRTRFEVGPDSEMGTDDDVFAYTTSMKVKDLLLISAISHRKRQNTYSMGKKMQGYYQRILKKSRLSRTSEKGVPYFIEQNRRPFINNLLINYRGDVPLKDIFIESTSSTERRGGLLKFPELNPGMFHVMDGQHRLFGYAPLYQENAKCEHAEHELIITIFDNLEPLEEAELFLAVNKNQQGIPSDLILEIEQMFGAEGDSKRVLRNIISNVIDTLKLSPNSPFHKPVAIKDSENIKSIDKHGELISQGKLTKTGLFTSIYKSKLIKQMNDDYTTGLGFVDKGDKYDSYSATIDNLVKIYTKFFGLIKGAKPDWWVQNNGRSNDEKIAQNIPMGGFILLLDHLILQANPNLKQGKNVFSEKMKDYLVQLEDSIKKMSPTDEDDLFDNKTYGGSGPEEAFFTLLNKFFPKLITPQIRERIQNTKQKYLSKRGKISKTEMSFIDDAKNMKGGTEGERALKQESALFRLLHGFFRKIMGEDYWKDYIENEFKKVRDEANKRKDERYQQLLKKGYKRPQEKMYKQMIYWCYWSEFRELIETMHKKSVHHQGFLDTVFTDSDEFMKDYEGKLSKLLEELFFIREEGSQTVDRENQLIKWINIWNNARREPSHKRDEPYLTTEEKEEFNELFPKVQEVLIKLQEFVDY